MLEMMFKFFRFNITNKARTNTGAVDVCRNAKTTRKKEFRAVMVTCATVLTISSLRSHWPWFQRSSSVSLHSIGIRCNKLSVFRSIAG